MNLGIAISKTLLTKLKRMKSAFRHKIGTIVEEEREPCCVLRVTYVCTTVFKVYSVLVNSVLRAIILFMTINRIAGEYRK